MWNRGIKIRSPWSITNNRSFSRPLFISTTNSLSHWPLTMNEYKNERVMVSKKSVLHFWWKLKVFTSFLFERFFANCLKGGSVAYHWGWFVGVLPHSMLNLFSLYFHFTSVRDAVVTIIAYISKSPCTMGNNKCFLCSRKMSSEHIKHRMFKLPAICPFFMRE